MVVGLSGGSDSIALVRLLLELAEYGSYVVVGAAHLNHRLRASSEEDEAFCGRFAGRHGLPFVAERADVRGYAAAERLSLEDAARRLRYAFLDRVAARFGADRIAVGHTQDDQAETVLLRLMRGAGLTGLAGIQPRRGPVVRPLLDVTDADLQSYLRDLGEAWVEDETNADLGIPRNRIRHRVLPELDRAAGASTQPAIARAAAAIRDDAAWLDELAEERFGALRSGRDAGLSLDLEGLLASVPPVRRRVLLRAIRSAAAGREVGMDHVEAVLGLLEGGQGGVDLPGCRVELRGGRVVFLPPIPAAR